MSYYVHRLGLVVKVLSRQIGEIEDELYEIGQRNANGDPDIDDESPVGDTCRLIELQNALSALHNPLGGELGEERRLQKERNAAIKARWAKEDKEAAIAQR